MIICDQFVVRGHIMFAGNSWLQDVSPGRLLDNDPSSKEPWTA